MEVVKKIEELEKEIQNLKNLVLLKEDALSEKRLVSLRGMGNLLVSKKEIEKAIGKAKKSLFAGIENALRGGK